MAINTLLPTPLQNSRPFDEIWTPDGVASVLFPHIPEEWIVWESAPGSGQLVRFLKSRYAVVAEEQDYFVWEPEQWDCMISNPPYSLKHEWLRRATELNKPYALLLPVTTLGVRRCQYYLHDVEIIFLPRRVDFTGKKAPWFSVMWCTRGLNIGQQLNFAAEGDCKYSRAQ